MHGNGVLPLVGSHQSKSNMTVEERIRKSKNEDHRHAVQIFNGSKYSYGRGKLS